MQAGSAQKVRGQAHAASHAATLVPAADLAHTQNVRSSLHLGRGQRFWNQKVLDRAIGFQFLKTFGYTPSEPPIGMRWLIAITRSMTTTSATYSIGSSIWLGRIWPPHFG